MIRSLDLPVPLPGTEQALTLRRASQDDLHALMRLLADDPVSAGRGDRADVSDISLLTVPL